jgi:glutamate synthase domain-containing protein 3
MTPPPDGADRDVPVVSIPDIRDYHKVNAELVALLDAGYRRVRLAGTEGQRLLVSGLRGSWNALIEIEGRAGTELAAELNAPGLSIVCRGPAADGAGRGLRGGRLIILEAAGPAVGYAIEGGTIVVLGPVGPRAGLNQHGGTIVVLGPVGPLAAERQAGGRFVAFEDKVGPHAGRGRRGGALDFLSRSAPPLAPADFAPLTTFEAIEEILASRLGL